MADGRNDSAAVRRGTSRLEKKDLEEGVPMAASVLCRIIPSHQKLANRELVAQASCRGSVAPARSAMPPASGMAGVPGMRRLPARDRRCLCLSCPECPRRDSCHSKHATPAFTEYGRL